MGSKPNWACVNCGMYSSRKSSVKRHIRTLHESGHIVSFTDYLVGRQAGFYPFGPFPSFEKNDSKEEDMIKTSTRVFNEGYWSEAGKEAFRKEKHL
jgi:hypothetical protein